MGGSPKKQAGLRIRRLRRSNQMSQRALAAAVGVHVNTVARWESTGIEPDHPRLPSIAAALHCALEQLTGESEHKIPLFISWRRDDVGDWPASKRQVLVRFLKAYRDRLPELRQGR
jgi:transcriptional regulator with XRE-family HTH domain